MAVENHAVFSIEYTTKADMAGAKAQLAMLQGQREALAAMGKETSVVEAKIEKLRHAINQSELFGGLSESAKKAEHAQGELLEGKHGIHAIGHGLNEALPGVMQFSRFLTSGFAAAIGAVVLAFGYLQEKLEEFKNFLEQIDTGPGARGEWAQKTADNIREASVEAAVFAEHLSNLVTAQERLTRSTETTLQAIHQQFSDSNIVADQQRQLELARLALREQLGQISSSEAIRLRLEIDDAAFRRELEAKKAEIQAELNVRIGQLSANAHREPSLNTAKERADSAALAARNAQDTNEAKLAQDKENLAAAQESMRKSEERLTQPHHMGDRADTFIRDQAEKNVDQQQNTIALLTRSIQQEKGKQTPLAEAAALAKAQADKAKSDYEAAEKASDDIRQIVQKLQADLAAATARTTALENIHTQTAQAQADTHELERFKKIFEEVRAGHGDQLAPDDLAQFNALRDSITTGRATSSQRRLWWGIQDSDQAPQGRADQTRWANTPADQVPDLAEMRAAVGSLRMAAQAHTATNNDATMLFHELTGLGHDLHTALRTQFAELARDVAELREQIRNNRTTQ